MKRTYSIFLQLDLVSFKLIIVIRSICGDNFTFSIFFNITRRLYYLFRTNNYPYIYIFSANLFLGYTY